MSNKNYQVLYTPENDNRPSDFYWNAAKIHDEVLYRDRPNLNKVQRFFQKWKCYPDVWTWYYQALLKNHRNVEAQKCLDKIEELFPNYFYGKLSRALDFLDEQEFEKAREILGERPDITLMMPGKSEFYYEDLLKYYAAYVQLEIALDNIKAADDILKEAVDLVGDQENLIVTSIEKMIFRYRLDTMAERLKKSKEMLLCPEFIDTNDYEGYSQKPFVHADIQQLYDGFFKPEKENIDKILSLPRTSLVQDLENVIRKTIYEKPLEADDEFNLDILSHAIYFLTELKAAESYPVILQLLRQDSEFFESWFDDMFELISTQLLYYIALEYPQELLLYLKEPNRYTFFKASGFEALEAVAMIHPEKRSEVLAYYKELLDFYYQEKDNCDIIDTRLIGCIENSALNLGFKELLPDFEKYHQENLIDEMHCGNIEDVRKEFERGNLKTEFKLLNIYELFERDKEWFESSDADELNDENTAEIDEVFKKYLGSGQRETEESSVHSDPKVGRNAPCPCGSGKKYKKCCGK